MSLLASYSQLLSRNRWAKGQCESALAQSEARLQQLQQQLAELAAQEESLRLLSGSLAPEGILSRSDLFTGQRKQAVIKTRLAGLRAQEAAIRQDIMQTGELIAGQRQQRQQLIRKDKKFEQGYQGARRQRQQARQRSEDNDAEESIYGHQR